MSPPTWLHTLVRKANGNIYVFAVNDGNGEGKILFSLPEGAKSVKEVTEDVEVKVDGMQFEDQSKRLGVKVYEIAPE